MLIKCALVDDEKRAIQEVKNTLDQLSYGSSILFDMHAYTDPKQLNLSEKYDVYILDIDMPGMNGFELTNKIYEKYSDAIVMFCTQHENFVFDSYRLNAFYFIRKSFLQTDLISAFQKYFHFHAGERHSYIAKVTEGSQKIAVSDILYFEIVHNDLYIHLKNNTEIKERKTLKSVTAELSKENFIQVSQTYLVNGEHIEQVIDSKVWLSNGQKIDIPKANVTRVVNEFIRMNAR